MAATIVPFQPRYQSRPGRLPVNPAGGTGQTTKLAILEVWATVQAAADTERRCVEQIECPHCFAQPNERCETVSGRKRGEPHEVRFGVFEFTVGLIEKEA